ncbi:MAG: exopolysaccharide biosynthesis GT4 family glycosyltransferase EpsE [Pseudorhizobium sp.]
MTDRIGFLIPEFPGQTHIFLWRERQALADLGIDAQLVSTTQPPAGIVSHSWSQAARNETLYLMPFTIGDGVIAMVDLVRCGSARWRALADTIRGADVETGWQRLRLLAMVLPAAKLARAARRRGWNHLHVHSCGNAANVAMLCSILSDVRYSLTLHGPTLELYGSNQRQKWRHSRFATVISKRLYRDVVERLSLAPADRVHVAPMGVDVEAIRRRQPYPAWSQGQRCRLFSCGRLNAIKGHEDLLQVVLLLRHRGLDVHLRIAGEDEQGGRGYRRQLEDDIRRAGLQDRVTLLGAVNEEQIRQELEEAHIFVLASHNEGISVAIMEAMSMEMPVVVTDVGGNCELIEQGVDGLLVADAKPEEFAQAVLRVLADQQLATKLRTNSRAKIISHFNHYISAAKLAACLAGGSAVGSSSPDTSIWLGQSSEGVSAIGAQI